MKQQHKQLANQQTHKQTLQSVRISVIPSPPLLQYSCLFSCNTWLIISSWLPLLLLHVFSLHLLLPHGLLIAKILSCGLVRPFMPISIVNDSEVLFGALTRVNTYCSTYWSAQSYWSSPDQLHNCLPKKNRYSLLYKRLHVDRKRYVPKAHRPQFIRQNLDGPKNARYDAHKQARRKRCP